MSWGNASGDIESSYVDGLDMSLRTVPPPAVIFSTSFTKGQRVTARDMKCVDALREASLEFTMGAKQNSKPETPARTPVLQGQTRTPPMLRTGTPLPRLSSGASSSPAARPLSRGVGTPAASPISYDVQRSPRSPTPNQRTGTAQSSSGVVGAVGASFGFSNYASVNSSLMSSGLETNSETSNSPRPESVRSVRSLASLSQPSSSQAVVGEVIAHRPNSRTSLHSVAFVATTPSRVHGTDLAARNASQADDGEHTHRQNLHRSRIKADRVTTPCSTRLESVTSLDAVHVGQTLFNDVGIGSLAIGLGRSCMHWDAMVDVTAPFASPSVALRPDGSLSRVLTARAADATARDIPDGGRYETFYSSRGLSSPRAADVLTDMPVDAIAREQRLGRQVAATLNQSPLDLSASSRPNTSGPMLSSRNTSSSRSNVSSYFTGGEGFPVTPTSATATAANTSLLSVSRVIPHAVSQRRGDRVDFRDNHTVHALTAQSVAAEAAHSASLLASTRGLPFSQALLLNAATGTASIAPDRSLIAARARAGGALSPPLPSTSSVTRPRTDAVKKFDEYGNHTRAQKGLMPVWVAYTNSTESTAVTLAPANETALYMDSIKFTSAVSARGDVWGSPRVIPEAPPAHVAARLWVAPVSLRNAAGAVDTFGGMLAAEAGSNEIVLAIDDNAAAAVAADAVLRRTHPFLAASRAADRSAATVRDETATWALERVAATAAGGSKTARARGQTPIAIISAASARSPSHDLGSFSALSAGSVLPLARKSSSFAPLAGMPSGNAPPPSPLRGARTPIDLPPPSLLDILENEVGGGSGMVSSVAAFTAQARARTAGATVSRGSQLAPSAYSTSRAVHATSDAALERTTLARSLKTVHSGSNHWSSVPLAFADPHARAVQPIIFSDRERHERPSAVWAAYMAGSLRLASQPGVITPATRAVQLWDSPRSRAAGGNDAPSPLAPAVCDFTGVETSVGGDSVRLGALRVGTEYAYSLRIRNPTPFPRRFRLVAAGWGDTPAAPRANMSIRYKALTLAPGLSATLALALRALEPGLLDGRVSLQSDDGELLHVRLLAHSLLPVVFDRMRAAVVAERSLAPLERLVKANLDRDAEWDAEYARQGAVNPRMADAPNPRLAGADVPPTAAAKSWGWGEVAISPRSTPKLGPKTVSSKFGPQPTSPKSAALFGAALGAIPAFGSLDYQERDRDVNSVQSTELLDELMRAPADGLLSIATEAGTTPGALLGAVLSAQRAQPLGALGDDSSAAMRVVSRALEPTDGIVINGYPIFPADIERMPYSRGTTATARAALALQSRVEPISSRVPLGAPYPFYAAHIQGRESRSRSNSSDSVASSANALTISNTETLLEAVMHKIPFGGSHKLLVPLVPTLKILQTETPGAFTHE